MVKTGNDTPNHAHICREATQEWNKIKAKSAEEINDIIKKHLTIPFNLYNIQTMKSRYFVPEESSTSFLSTINSVEPISEIPINAAAQKSVTNKIEIAEKKTLRT
ncbi:15187_t:CDS:1 [Dentiscutata erythropus]|uniref:15187_t:CDS:1 n=1 Tax=Dentiscutata erythropus TaxID=1348616 RepID=A0A9N9CVV9_9GLOM|nr:15187_t:CDS:1 [Dentiscutata erythropus]